MAREVEVPHIAEDPRHPLTTARLLSRIASLCERVPVKPKVKITKLKERTPLAWTYGGKRARCPYCRDVVDIHGRDVDACVACATIHHKECLQEAGGCTVLGCSAAPNRRRRRA